MLIHFLVAVRASTRYIRYGWRGGGISDDRLRGLWARIVGWMALMVVVMMGHGVLVGAVLLLGAGSSRRCFIGWRRGPEAVGAGDEALDSGELKVRPYCTAGEEHKTEADENEDTLDD